MSDLLGVIKQAAVEAYHASRPVAVQIGIVEKASPLVIRLDQKLSLTASLLIKPKHVDLYAKDKVILIRVQGGQQFVVLGVV